MFFSNSTRCTRSCSINLSTLTHPLCRCIILLLHLHCVAQRCRFVLIARLQCPHLWREVSPGNIRLTSCTHCGSVADPYIEYELILIVLDLLSQSSRAYRHLLHNTHFATTHQVPPALLFFALITLQLLALAAVALLSADAVTALAHT